MTTKGEIYTDEHTLQVSCVQWFATFYPHRVLLAIPNGGRRDATTGARLKAEGVLSGVADLFLAVAASGYHGLWLEVKTLVGRQSPSQRDFEKKMVGAGYMYAVVNTKEAFIQMVRNYLNDEIPHT